MRKLVFTLAAMLAGCTNLLAADVIVKMNATSPTMTFVDKATGEAIPTGEAESQTKWAFGERKAQGLYGTQCFIHLECVKQTFFSHFQEANASALYSYTGVGRCCVALPVSQTRDAEYAGAVFWSAYACTSCVDLHYSGAQRAACVFEQPQPCRIARCFAKRYASSSETVTTQKYGTHRNTTSIWRPRALTIWLIRLWNSASDGRVQSLFGYAFRNRRYA